MNSPFIFSANLESTVTTVVAFGFGSFSLYTLYFSFSAEAAHLLIRSVNYEIPSLKRQIGKCQQTQRVRVHFRAFCLKLKISDILYLFSECR